MYRGPTARAAARIPSTKQCTQAATEHWDGLRKAPYPARIRGQNPKELSRPCVAKFTGCMLWLFVDSTSIEIVQGLLPDLPSSCDGKLGVTLWLQAAA